MLVGYGEPYGLKGYRVFLPGKGKIVTSPNVLFLDDMEDSISKRPPDLIATQDPSILQPSSVANKPFPRSASHGLDEMSGNDHNGLLQPTVEMDFDESPETANQREADPPIGAQIQPQSHELQSSQTSNAGAQQDVDQSKCSFS